MWPNYSLSDFILEELYDDGLKIEASVCVAVKP